MKMNINIFVIWSLWLNRTHRLSHHLYRLAASEPLYHEMWANTKPPNRVRCEWAPPEAGAIVVFLQQQQKRTKMKKWGLELAFGIVYDMKVCFFYVHLFIDVNMRRWKLNKNHQRNISHIILEFSKSNIFPPSTRRCDEFRRAKQLAIDIICYFRAPHRTVHVVHATESKHRANNSMWRKFQLKNIIILLVA